MDNKAQAASIGLLIGLGVALVVFGVTTSTGATVVNKVEAQLPTRTINSTAYNATQNANKGIEELTGWSETISTVAAAAVILSLIGMFAVAVR